MKRSARGFKLVDFGMLRLEDLGGDQIVLHAPFNEEANALYRNIPGSFDKMLRAWVFWKKDKEAVLQALFSVYGTSGGPGVETVDVLVRADFQEVHHKNGNLYFAGRLIAARRRPEDAPQLGKGVRLTSDSKPLSRLMGAPSPFEVMTILGPGQRWSDLRFKVSSVPVAWFAKTRWAGWFDHGPGPEPVDLGGLPPNHGKARKVSLGRLISWWVIVMGGEVEPAEGGALGFVLGGRTVHTAALSESPDALRELLDRHSEVDDGTFNVMKES